MRHRFRSPGSMIYNRPHNDARWKKTPRFPQVLNGLSATERRGRLVGPGGVCSVVSLLACRYWLGVARSPATAPLIQRPRRRNQRPRRLDVRANRQQGLRRQPRRHHPHQRSSRHHCKHNHPHRPPRQGLPQHRIRHERSEQLPRLLSAPRPQAPPLPPPPRRSYRSLPTTSRRLVIPASPIPSSTLPSGRLP
jgi:hypothetical protein